MTEHEELAAAMGGASGERGLPEVAHALTEALDGAGLLPTTGDGFGGLMTTGDLVRGELLGALREQPVLTADEVRDLLTRFYNRSDDEAARVVGAWLDRRRDGR